MGAVKRWWIQKTKEKQNMIIEEARERDRKCTSVCTFRDKQESAEIYTWTRRQKATLSS